MQTKKWIEDDEGVVARRATARNLLPQLTQQVKAALKEAGIDLDVFLMVPMSGDAVATFGTVIDPPEEEWARVSEIVCSIVREAVGLDRVRSREPDLTSVDLTAMPMPACATGAETR